MKLIKIGAVITLLFFTASVYGLSDVKKVNTTNLVQEEVVIDEEHELSWKSYSLSYSHSDTIDSHSITLTDQRGVLIEQYTGTELFENFGDIQEVSENLFIRLDELDREDEELELTVWASEGSFGSSKLNITAPQYIVVENDEDFTVPMEVENTGGVEEVYDLSADTMSSASSSFMYEGYNVTKLVVEPGEAKQVQAEIALEDDIGRGIQTINFSVFDKSFSSKNFSFQVTNSIDEERTLRMNLEDSYTELNSGKQFEIGVRVQNFGDSTVEDVEPSISVPGNWNYSLEPEETGNISSEEFQDFDLTVGVPSTATTGDYFVDVGLENTEDFDDQKLRVNVSDTSSGFGLIGLVLALFAVLLVAVVYKVFGRR